MERKIISTGILLGLTAIILGAFGAHALKKELSTEQLAAFEIAVKYQMYHAFFLLFLGSTDHITNKVKKKVFLFVISGVFLFSGSIFLLSTKTISGIDIKLIGAITPVGGAFLIIAWSMGLWSVWKSKR